MKTIKLKLILFVLSVIFLSCNDNDNYGLESLRCDLTIVNATDGGVISGVGSGIFKRGDDVNLSVVLKENYILIGWYNQEQNTLLCEELEYNFTIQEEKTIIELRYLRTDEDVTIVSDIQRVEGFYKDKKSVTFTVSSSAYDKYMAYIIPDNVNVADFTLNGESANLQNKIKISNGKVPVTIYIKSMTEGTNTNFKLVVYPILAPENKEEYSVSLVNNGASFTVIGGGTFTLRNTNASQSGSYLVSNALGSANYSITCSESESFKAHVSNKNGIGEFLIDGQSFKGITGINSSKTLNKSGSITLGRNYYKNWLGYDIYDYTYFNFKSNMGGSIGENNNNTSLGWASSFQETIYITNSAGYAIPLYIAVKFNR